jgi:hypothetical protein
MVDMVVHRHELRGTLARICNVLTHRQIGRDIAISAHDEPDVRPAAALDGNSHGANGHAIEHADGENEDEALTGAPSNGANPNPLPSA